MPKGPEAVTQGGREARIRSALARYERPLVRFARRLVGDQEAARDIAQDCFLRLCQQATQPEDGHLAPWLFTVCRRRAIDHLRKNGRMPNLNGTAFLELAPEAVEAPSPAHAAAEGDEAARIQAFVAELAPRQQELLRLKFQDGLSYREIAEITELSVSNVGFILHTALKALRVRAARTPSKATERSPR